MTRINCISCDGNGVNDVCAVNSARRQLSRMPCVVVKGQRYEGRRWKGTSNKGKGGEGVGSTWCHGGQQKLNSCMLRIRSVPRADVC